MEQPKQTKKLPGFYIALCCCVIAIGAAGFFAQKAEPKQSGGASISANTAENEPISEAFIGSSDSAFLTADTENTEDSAEDEEETQNEDSLPPIVSEPEAEDAAAIEEYAIDNPDVLAASVTVNAADGGMMLDPVPASAVLAGFSNEKLQYNSVFGDWRAHNGVDLAASLGSSVSAAADGTVTEIGEGSNGKYIKIDHGNDITAIYAQLNEIYPSEGDSVSAGSVIGTVGSSRGENVSEPHLHFEIIKGGSYVNPEEY